MIERKRVKGVKGEKERERERKWKGEYRGRRKGGIPESITQEHDAKSWRERRTQKKAGHKIITYYIITQKVSNL